MDISKALFRVALGVAIAATAGAQKHIVVPPPSGSIFALSDTELVALIHSHLDQGVPLLQGEEYVSLVRNRSSLILPILEAKVEQVLRSPNPMECFSNKNADPKGVVDAAASLVTYAGDELALQVASNLLKLDEKRFSQMVSSTLMSVVSAGENPFRLAYRGADIGDPAVDKGIAGWVAEMLAHRIPEWPGGPRSLERKWAEAMVERYSGVPLEGQWRNDPIVSRLQPEFAASLHDYVLRIAAEEWEIKSLPNRLSEAEQIAFVKAQLDQGIPRPQSELDQGVPREPREALLELARTRSSVVLPVIESKIEQVLRSPDPTECFADKAVPSQAFLGVAASMIAEAGNEQALKQASKLLKLRSSGLVFGILSTANRRGNPFPLAYRGLEMSDPDMDKAITAWAEQAFTEPMVNLPKDMRHQWAEAMVDRYGGAPEPVQWAKDPLVHLLKPTLAESLHRDIVRLAMEARDKRAKN